jgi:ATP-binding cassette subfamily G (WHITE) protein 2 (PDR)
MYRFSPFTYLIGGLLSTGFANTPVTCADNEFVNFSPPSGVTCGDYMQPYFDQAPGYLQNPDDTQSCGFCSYGDIWRNFGLMWVYIFVNIGGAVASFWLARVPKSKK